MALSNAMALNAIARPHYPAYEQWKRLASVGDQQSARTCVDEVLKGLKILDGQKKFSLATAFPGEWPPPLASIWEFWGEDQMMAALTLGCIVMDYLIDDDLMWMCFKTDLQDRGFETNFYWCDV
jgi:hypothetical protein